MLRSVALEKNSFKISAVSLSLFIILSPSTIFIFSFEIILFHNNSLTTFQNILLSQKFFSFKACVRYFLSNFYFSPNDGPSKTMKNIFSSKKLFSFWRYSHFCVSVFPSFSPCQPLL